MTVLQSAVPRQETALSLLGKCVPMEPGGNGAKRKRLTQISSYFAYRTCCCLVRKPTVTKQLTKSLQVLDTTDLIKSHCFPSPFKLRNFVISLQEALAHLRISSFLSNF